MTHTHPARRSTTALTVSSIILIILSIPALAYEVRGAIDGATNSTAALAVGASCVSALVGLVFLAWLARFTPSILSWIAAFAWGEDIGYYVSALDEGMGGLWESFLARALLGAFGHAIFTGVFGFALCWAILRAKNVFVGIAAGLGGFAGAVLLHAQANGVGFLAPEDSWNLTYGAIEVPILAVSVALLVWGMRRRRATLEA